MSNFVHNLLTVTGKQAEIGAFIQRFCVEQEDTIELSYGKALPMPRAPRGGQVAWANKHWGTADAETFIVEEREDGRLTLALQAPTPRPWRFTRSTPKPFPR